MESDDTECDGITGTDALSGKSTQFAVIWQESGTGLPAHHSPLLAPATEQNIAHQPKAGKRRHHFAPPHRIQTGH